MTTGRMLRPTFGPEDFQPLTNDLVVRAMKDFKEFCRQSFVYNDVNIPVPFELNPAQELFCEFVLRHLYPLLNRRDGRAYHIVIHKSRQQGISTVCMKLEQWINTNHNFHIIHIMPTEDEAREMVELKAQPLFEATRPELLGTIVPSRLHFDFVKRPEVLGGKKLGGRLTYMSAGTKGAGHGRTLQILIQDEYAKYQDPNTHEAGLLPAMEKGDFPTLRIVIFTAKGMNHAYDLVKEAKKADSDWDTLFLPWYIMPQYEMEPEGRYKDLSDLTDYDVFLCDEFKKNNVPMEKWQRKLQWYNYTLKNVAANDQNYMFENYPTTDMESFQSTGSPIFDSVKCYKWQDAGFDRYEIFEDRGRSKIELDRNGILRVKYPPIRGHKYIMGVDMSEGGEQGDNSAIRVFDTTSNIIQACCTYSGKIEQETLASIAYDVAMWYNRCLIVPERNRGDVFIKWITDVKRYGRIFSDKKAVTDYRSLGVTTTNNSKNEMISRMRFLINNNYYEDYDPEFCQEAIHFAWERTPSGMMKAGGTAGFHDDLVMASLIFTLALDMKRFKGWDDLMHTASERKQRKYS